MKRHLPGVFIALVTFSAGFYLSPIRFISSGAGHGATTDGRYECRFSVHVSNHFVSLSFSSCNFESPEKAREILWRKANEASGTVTPASDFKLQHGSEIQRAVYALRYKDFRLYCMTRADGKWVDDICSTSLRHVLEFEQQAFKQ